MQIAIVSVSARGPAESEPHRTHRAAARIPSDRHHPSCPANARRPCPRRSWVSCCSGASSAWQLCYHQRGSSRERRDSHQKRPRYRCKKAWYVVCYCVEAAALCEFKRKVKLKGPQHTVLMHAHAHAHAQMPMPMHDTYEHGGMPACVHRDAGVCAHHATTHGPALDDAWSGEKERVAPPESTRQGRPASFCPV